MDDAEAKLQAEVLAFALTEYIHDALVGVEIVEVEEDNRQNELLPEGVVKDANGRVVLEFPAWEIQAPAFGGAYPGGVNFTMVARALQRDRNYTRYGGPVDTNILTILAVYITEGEAR